MASSVGRHLIWGRFQAEPTPALNELQTKRGLTLHLKLQSNIPNLEPTLNQKFTHIGCPSSPQLNAACESAHATRLMLPTSSDNVLGHALTKHITWVVFLLVSSKATKQGGTLKKTPHI